MRQQKYTSKNGQRDYQAACGGRRFVWFGKRVAVAKMKVLNYSLDGELFRQ
jgi:hypothetical protein